MPGDGSRATTIFKLKHFGSGQFSAITGAAEATGSNPPDQTLLFTFAGFSTSSETTKVPQTTIETKIFGTAIERHTESYAGSGSLFGFSSTTESTAVSPDDTKVLFSISGSVIERLTKSYAGSGSLFGFSSTTESIAVSPDDTGTLFTFFGTAANSIAPAPHIGSGSLFTFISKTESTAVSPDDTKVLFSISGDAVVNRTASHAGSGSLFGFSSTTESTAVSPDDTKVLFRITSGTRESFARSNYNGHVLVDIDGAVSNHQYVTFVAPRKPRIYVI